MNFAWGITIFVVATIAIAVLVVRVVNATERENKTAFRQAKEKLAGKKFMVAIRGKDGRRTYQETLFIQELINLGVEVLDLSPKNGDRVWIGELNSVPIGVAMFIGTAWEENDICYIDGRFFPERGAAMQNEPIRAAFYLAYQSVYYLGGAMARCVQK